MAIIAFSDAFQTSTLSSLKTIELAGSTAKIGFYKGTVPTDFSELTGSGARSSDQLVLMNTNSSSYWTQSGTSVILTTTFTSAYASGVATWFFWYNTGVGFPALVGTIGALGSGEDLELGNTTINSGAYYRVNQWALSLPVPYTY
jgi:hypothetical protein